jgi:hypothetical protein
MPHQRRGLIGQLVPGKQHSDKHVDVLAAPRLGAHTKRFIEATESSDDAAAHGEVGACTELTDLEGEQVLVPWRC